MKKLKTILLLIVTLITISCNDSGIAPKADLDLTRYSALRQTLVKDYDALSTGLRSANSKIGNESTILNIAGTHYGKSSNEYSFFINSYSNLRNSSNNRLASFGSLSQAQKERIQQIIESINEFGSLSDYQTYLDSQFNAIVAEDLSLTDKDFLLTYIVSYKVTLDFVENNSDLLASTNQVNGRTQGWWDDWGKCAAGIVGSAITTGATLGLGGAAVGTVALPVVGTVSGAAVGAVAGAIGGALVGAATFC